MLGSVLIAMGGLGAGSTRQHDPLLESIHMSWMRFGHGLVLSSIVLWTGVGLMLIAWLALGRRVLAGEATEFMMKATTGFWLAPLLVSVPVFSRDTYSYLAQGALLRDGLDPYAVGPVANPNILLDNVSPIWTITTAPYGPAFILVAKLVTMIVGNNVVAGTMLLRLCMLPGLALLIWATPRLARHLGADAATALWICVLNPLVLIHLMGGVHNEMLMVGLMAAGIALSFGGRHVLGTILITVAIAVKATAGISLPFLVWVWMRHLRDRRGYRPAWAFLTATAISLLIFAVVFGILSAVAGVGLGWLTALAGSVKIINWLTVPTASGEPDPRPGQQLLLVGLLPPASSHPVHRNRDHRGVAAAVVVAVPARRPGRADRHRLVDGDCGAFRPGRSALVLLLAAGGRGPAGPVATGGRNHCRAVDLGDGDLQTRWLTRHVLMAAFFPGHRLRGDCLVQPVPGPRTAG